MVYVNLQIHFYGLKFEDLYKFVNAARVTGVDPSSKVPLLERNDDYERELLGFQLELDDETFKGFPEPLTPDEVQRLATVLDELLTTEDPHKLFSELLQWRDRLRESWQRSAKPAGAD
ncbi:hypothetical protein [Nonomuraea aurantiaca]|uniref:hypothetical protein n=1 Tax=Nonomuraea aurantiaca TaxID=2878562 RepID=UPI001CD9E287|nr:hypothetical protein [Nonomuraea aurantiaca]MCA2228494.1 hypothetical protein [Nonomuraea aurantiaca]